MEKNLKNFQVTHSNELVYSKYDLSLNAQKLIMILASHIQPDDNSFKEIEFKAKDLAEIMNVSVKNMYKELPKITYELLSKVIYFKYENDKKSGFLQGTFLSTADYVQNEGRIILEFSPKIAPYLLQLKTLFTKYKLINPLSFKSKYSIRLYQIFKVNEFKGIFEIELSELKNILKTQKSYDIYNNFKEKIIKNSLEEINKTDIQVYFEEIKTGRKVTSLKFIIKSNKENKKLLSDNLNDISVENSEIISDKNVLILKELFQDQVSIKNLKKILESANNDIEKIKKIYEYSKTQKIDNLVGFMIKMVKDSNFEEPIKQDKDYKKIHNFTEREDYDYQKLEEGLLGWDNDEILESIEENKIDTNKGSKMDFKVDENKNRSNTINEIKNILEGQLTAIFGELRYKTWIKPSVDNIEIENNNINFVFSNDFVKKKFENEFENIVIEIIKEVDSKLKIKKD